MGIGIQASTMGHHHLHKPWVGIGTQPYNMEGLGLNQWGEVSNMRIDQLTELTNPVLSGLASIIQ